MDRLDLFTLIFMDPISANNRAVTTTRAAPTTLDARAGEILSLRIESKAGEDLYTGRSADGRQFLLNARTTPGMLPGMELQIGQMLRMQVLSVRPQFQLALLDGPPQQQTSQTASTTNPMALQAQIQTGVDAEAGSDAHAFRPEQLLLQRAFQQGMGNEAPLLAQAWLGLVLTRLRQWPNLPPGSSRPPAMDAATLLLLQGLSPQDAEVSLATVLNASAAGGAQANNPASTLPQFWMFHAYAWNNTLPLNFWVLRRQDAGSGGRAWTGARPATLRLRIEHPVYGPLWIDVRMDDMSVMVDIYAENGTMAEVADWAQQLRPAISTALARSSLRLLRFHIQPGLPPRHVDDEQESMADLSDPSPAERPALTHTQLQTAGRAMQPFPATPPFSEALLAPELFLAATEVLGALRVSQI